MKFSFSLFLVLFTASFAFGQTATVKGVISNARGEGIDGVAIFVAKKGIIADEQGVYQFEVPSGEKIIVVFNHISFETDTAHLFLKENEIKTLNRTLSLSKNELGTIVLEDNRSRETGEVNIDPVKVDALPSVNESVEALISTLAGVVSNNELSSQYSVRGGNFDENLVYVNGIQIYRPFLVRNGQQEGLSFVNPDMVSDIKFSAGGFEAKYGDKMSSVLDITYKEPKKFGSKITASLLGGSATVEGTSKDYRLNYIMSFRHRTTELLLGSMDTDADYRPSFTDFQAYLTYHIGSDWKINLLGNFAKNQYQYIPRTRQTEFGTVTEALRLTVYFDGQEIDQYQTGMGAISATYKPSDATELKWIASIFKTLEEENFDIQGEYFIGQLDNNLGSENFGDVAFNRGVGTYINHARNRLNAQVLSLEHKGKHVSDKATYRWGLKLNHELIEDKFSEWTMIDSAGYSLPTNSSTAPFELFESLKAKLNLSSSRVTAYSQRNSNFDTEKGDFSLTYGLRAHYWTVNKQIVFSPRANISFIPNWKKDILFRFASGFYYQPPFYRELRNFEGTLNKDVKAQQSIHFVLGSDYNFKRWDRPFKLTSEVYYKQLNNLIPYQIDNLRLRYYATNNSNGQAYGVDFKINGEFVKGIESWASVSVMQIREDITNDSYFDLKDSVMVQPGYIPRPTDQRVSFSLFFQDYLPSDPSFSVNLGLHFSTGLPFGPPKSERYQQTLRTPPYRRVDLGFSKIFKEEGSKVEKMKFLNTFDSVWFTVEIFNILQINNTTSYLWVSDVSGGQFAVPNFLTSRLLNIKLKLTF
ncbi:MAG: hypothetical protein ACI8P7_000990 [Candidatus Azotimanducaceae bacterium]|jgi:hypothetical protein